MDHKDEKELKNNVLSPEEAGKIMPEISESERKLLEGAVLIEENSDAKHDKDAEKLIRAGLGADVFERGEKPMKAMKRDVVQKKETIVQNANLTEMGYAALKKMFEEKKINKREFFNEVERRHKEIKTKDKKEDSREAEEARQKQKVIDRTVADKDKMPSAREIAGENQRKIDEVFKEDAETEKKEKNSSKEPFDDVTTETAISGSGSKEKKSAEEEKKEPTEKEKEPTETETVEKEKTAKEILEAARGEFARMDLMAERYIKAEKKLKNKRTKADFVEYGGNGGKEYAEAKERYFEALRARRVEMLEEAVKQIEDKKLPKNKRNEEMKKIITAEVIKETVAREANYLYDKKMELDLELKGGESKFGKIWNVARGVGEWYRKQPLKYKIALSGVLFAGAFGAGVGGGAGAGTLLAGIFVGKGIQRGLGGLAATVGIEAWRKGRQEKKAEKKVSAEFADNLIESIKNGDKKLDERLLKLEGKKKWEKYRRFALAGSVGALIASGWTVKALGEIIPDDWADWAKDKMGIGTETAPTDEVSGGALDPEKVAQMEALKPKMMDPEKLAQAEALSKMSFTEVAEKGDSVWKMAEEQLAKNYGEKFAELDGARKTYLIDAIKDKIAADPGKFGLENLDKIKVGQKIDFSSIFNNKAGMDEIFRDASALKQAALDNIAENDKMLGDWAAAHPNEELTSGKIDEILGGQEVVTGEVAEKAGEVTEKGISEAGAKALLENEMAHIKALGFSQAEYEIIKDIKVEKLLKEIPSKEEAWEVFRQSSESGSKAIDLPSDGVRGAMEFDKQIKLAEFIRGFAPTENVKQMTVSQFLGTIGK